MTLTWRPSRRRNAVDLAKAFSLEKSEGKLRLTGLGARDSPPAFVCLYGNDMHLLRLALHWAIGKRRRAEGGILGAEVILKRTRGRSTTGEACRFLLNKPTPVNSQRDLEQQQGKDWGGDQWRIQSLLKEEHSNGLCEIWSPQARN
ncbi:hypothetical protein BHE74_00037885 [Ensete ventricosum]|nr:hypothetical protein BHE74_00037885 [Ensete ventricosum]